MLVLISVVWNFHFLFFNLLHCELWFRRKVSLSYPVEDEDAEEEADQVVPYGVEEVELARINLEQKERVLNTILDDIRKLSLCNDESGEAYSEKEFEAWMVTGGRSVLVRNTVFCAVWVHII